MQLPLAEVFVGLQAHRDRHPGDRARVWFEQEYLRDVPSTEIRVSDHTTTVHQHSGRSRRIRTGAKRRQSREVRASTFTQVIDTDAHALWYRSQTR